MLEHFFIGFFFLISLCIIEIQFLKHNIKKKVGLSEKNVKKLSSDSNTGLNKKFINCKRIKKICENTRNVYFRLGNHKKR